MSQYRNNLPQLGDELFLTDGGLETTLVFHDGIDLPCFAAFDLMKDKAGRLRLKDYYERYIAIARQAGTGFVLEAPTWRANLDWGFRLGYDAETVRAFNRASIDLMEELRQAHASPRLPMVISGCIGPRGDGYDPGAAMNTKEAQAYHAHQIGSFADSAADMVSAITMTNLPEALGLTRAAVAAGMPVAISFTLETDGCLPTGQELGDAIAELDDATGAAPAYYMINCVHPTHFETVLAGGADWIGRLRGIRANASTLSHAELDAATELDDGNPDELGAQYRSLRTRYPQLSVLGGCCGTDHRHVEAICQSCRVAA